MTATSSINKNHRVQGSRKSQPSKALTTRPRPHVTIKKEGIADLLRRIDPSHGPHDQATVESLIDQSNTALGCKTSEVALHLLSQIVELEHVNMETASDQKVETLLLRATAMLAELQPKTATEALLAAQMVGTQRAAMRFLEQATRNGLTTEGANAFVLQATRLMRLLNEQVETMAKLKGKGGQQRVVVEHVTVGAGGQAIVGTVIPGGRGTSGDDPR